VTNDQINAAIAEACGWTPDNRGLGWLSPHGYYAPEPDYCNCLNAMHEAEEVLGSEALFEAYYLKLYDVTHSTLWPIRATARERAEAFLRTLGKWEEGAE
jgi:hypothetical protein